MLNIPNDVIRKGENVTKKKKKIFVFLKNKKMIKNLITNFKNKTAQSPSTIY